MWGFITSLNDILIPYLKAIFQLSYTQANLINLCFFGAYFLMSIPAGSLVARVGYKRGMLLGFVVAAVGAFLFYPAAEQRSYSLFLGALFVLASGITLLQVAANPYVAILGRRSRLRHGSRSRRPSTRWAPRWGRCWALPSCSAASRS